MLIKLKKISPYNSVYVYHGVLFFLSLVFMIPFDSTVIPFFIFTGSAIIISLIIKPNLLHLGARFRNKRKNVNVIRRFSKYSLSILYSLLSSLLTLTIITVFKYREHIGLPAFFIFSFLYAITFSISISMYMNNSSDYLVKEKNMFFWVVRIVGIVISFFIFSLARNWVMRYMDITILEASSKVTVFAYAIIFFFIVLYFFMAIAKIPMLMYEGKEVKLKRRNSLNGKRHFFLVRYDVTPIVFSLAASFFILMIFCFLNKSVIVGFIIKNTLSMDTVNSFYCNGGYKILSKDKDARYLRVSDGNYRVFFPIDGDWKSYRLKCTNEHPYYILQPVLTNINRIELQMKADELINDLKNKN